MDLRRFGYKLLAAAVILTAGTGCSSLLDETELPPDQMTVEQLFQKMERASDPQGKRGRAKSYLQRQEVTTPRSFERDKEEFVEVKVLQPNLLKITTSEMTDTSSSPVSAVILNGKKGWLVDYTDNKVVDLSPELVTRYNEVFDIDTPQDKDYFDDFKSIKLSRCRVDDKIYYKLSCEPKSKNFGTLEIYVDASDFLTRIIRTTFKFTNPSVSYISQIRRYALCDGVMMPVETEVTHNGVTQKTRIIDYILDPKLTPQDFEPKLFQSNQESK